MARLTRRQFLEDSFLAAAVAAALPASDALAAPKKSKKQFPEIGRPAAIGHRRRRRPRGRSYRGLPGQSPCGDRLHRRCRRASRPAPGRGRRQAAGKNAQVRPRFPQGTGRQVAEHRFHCDSQPLARPVRDLVDAGRQGRLRGKAGRATTSARDAASPRSPASTGASARRALSAAR